MICAGCEDGERYGTRPLRPPCCTTLSQVSRSKIKRREVVDGARRIVSEKLREHQYREGYATSLRMGWTIIMSSIYGNR